MMPAAAVVVCALQLLGRSHANAPIQFVATPPAHASTNVEAFVTNGEQTIYLVTSSQSFKEAQADPWTAEHHEGCRKIAAIIVHEEWHLRYGSDERAAYQAQLAALQMLNARPDTINQVRSSMSAVLDQQARRVDRISVASHPGRPASPQ